jgi:hypothetical protein
MARIKELTVKDPIPFSLRLKGLGDLSGMTFARWTVIYKSSPNGGPKRWMCVCECGMKRNVSQASLRAGTSQSCGCLQKTGKTWTIEQHRASKRKWRAINKPWRLRNPLTRGARTPAWADQSQIKMWYEVAEVLSRSGVRYEVDHIVPLNGKTAIGLHTPDNLQVLAWWRNAKKGAKFDPNNAISVDSPML